MVTRRIRRRLGTVGYVEHPSEQVRIGDRLIPPWVDVVMPGAGGQPRLTLRFEVIDKIPQCREVRIASVDGGREVRPSDLKAVHVTQMLEEIFAWLSMRVVEEGDEQITAVEEWDEQAQITAVRDIAAARKGRHVRKVTPELLAEVAQIYRENIAGNPTQAVATAFGVSKRTASLYVQRAREAGHLPPTTRGKKQA